MQKNSYENKDFKKSLIFGTVFQTSSLSTNIAVTSIFGTNKVFLIYFVTLYAICKLSEFFFLYCFLYIFCIISNIIFYCINTVRNCINTIWRFAINIGDLLIT